MVVARLSSRTVPGRYDGSATRSRRDCSIGKNRDFHVKITGIIWLEDIVEELWHKHGVDQHEVKEVFRNAPYFRFVEKGNREGENVY
jgi:hypothetical protein